MEQDENNKVRSKDPAFLRHWKSWGSWYSWGSPVGMSLGWFFFIVGLGIFIFLITVDGGINVIQSL